MKTNSSGSQETTKGVLYGLVSAVCVAGYVITNKYIYTHYNITPIEYSIVFALSGGFYALLSFLYKVDAAKVKVFKDNLPSFFKLALAGTMAVSTFTIGLNYTSAVNASILSTLTIVTTALFSHLFMRERHSRAQLAWISLLFCGLYLAIVGVRAVRLQKGDSIVIAAMLFFGIGNAYSRVVMKRIGNAKLAPDARLMIGILFALVASVFFLRHFQVIFSLLPFAMLAGFFYWACMKTFARAVHSINANNTVVLNNAHIFITSAVGVWLLSEHYSVEKFIGSVIALVSIYHIAYKKRPNKITL